MFNRSALRWVWFLQLGTSRPHWLTSDFVFLQAMHWAARALFLFQSLYKLCTGSNVYLWFHWLRATPETLTTPYKIQHFCSYFTFSLHYLHILLLGLQRPIKTPNTDNNSCLLPRQYNILFNKNSQWILSWFLFFCNNFLFFCIFITLYFGMFSFSNHFA